MKRTQKNRKEEKKTERKEQKKTEKKRHQENIREKKRTGTSYQVIIEVNLKQGFIFF